MFAMPDYHMVVQFNLKSIGGCLQFARRLDVIPRRLGIAGRMTVHRPTRVRVSLNLSRLKRFAKSAGVAEWCMFLVLTRDPELSTTIRLCPFHLNTFKHRFRISRLLYPVTPPLSSRFA
jgi:hypothetical protein